MSEDKEFDGIKQNDNKMPGWYIYSFIGTIIFAVVYMVIYHVTDDWTQEREYAASVKEYNQTYGSNTGGEISSDKNPYSGNAEAIVAGEATFKAICSACHGLNAQGVVGPNLADNIWLHGNKEKQVFHVIMEGISGDQIKQKPSKGGMPSHKQSLGAKKVWEVVSYLESKYKNIN